MPTWLWLVPLGCVTLYVWLEVARGWLVHRMADDLRAQHRALDARAASPPCALCGSPTHTYIEHVRIPQAALAGREEEP